MTTALVLAGGGSLGAVEVGMLREIVRSGLHADFVVGSSAGAINSAYFASKPTLEGVDELATLWRRMTSSTAFGPRWLQLLRLLRGSSHVCDGGGLARFLAEALPFPLIEQTTLPLIIVASDLVTGEEVLLDKGDVLRAIAASTAIPGIFPSVNILGRDLVDGGVSNNAPISVAVRRGATRVVVLPTGFACAARQVPRHAIGRTMHAISLLVARQLVVDLERWRMHLPIHVAPPLCPMNCSPYDYTQAESLIQRGATSTRAWIADGGLDRNEIPGTLREHGH